MSHNGEIVEKIPVLAPLVMSGGRQWRTGSPGPGHVQFHAFALTTTREGHLCTGRNEPMLRIPLTDGRFTYFSAKELLEIASKLMAIRESGR